MKFKVSLLTVAVLLPILSSSAAVPSWRDYASCAAAYRANWQARLSGSGRTAAMSAMIDEQSNDYRKAAVDAYVKEQKAPEPDAQRAVLGYIQSNVTPYVAMDRAGSLDSFIDHCPQLETPPAG